MAEEWQVKENCRICFSHNLVTYFNFGNMPLVDSFIGAGESGDLRVPLAVCFCQNCALSQLSVVVHPKLLFSNYVYHSSVSNTFRAHCAAMAREVKALLGRESGLKGVDIASNDGCLLKEFKKEGYQVLGVDPAANLCELAEKEGIPSLAEFWSLSTAQKVTERIGKVDVITATNVLAHVDDLHGFVAAVAVALSDTGVFVIEFPYLRNLLKYNQFDTMYHEHLSYFLVKPLLHLFPQHHMRIADIQEVDIHGGSLRVSVVKEANAKIPTKSKVVHSFFEREEKEGLHALQPYVHLEENSRRVRQQLIEKLHELKALGKTVAAYGASAKGNTFVNYCRLDNKDLRFIVDDTPHKQGKLYAGTRISVISREHLQAERPDYLLILPWNFAREIMERNKEYRATGGKFIIAIPELKIVE